MPNDDDWRAYAACARVDPELFHPIARRGSPAWLVQVMHAKRVCRGCPVRSECLEWATEKLEHGIAGGATEEERAELRRRRGVRLSTPPTPVWAFCPPTSKREIEERAEAVREALRNGATPAGAAQRYGVTVRAAQRQQQQMRAEDTAKQAAADGEAS